MQQAWIRPSQARWLAGAAISILIFYLSFWALPALQAWQPAGLNKISFQVVNTVNSSEILLSAHIPESKSRLQDYLLLNVRASNYRFMWNGEQIFSGQYAQWHGLPDYAIRALGGDVHRQLSVIWEPGNSPYSYVAGYHGPIADIVRLERWQRLLQQQSLHFTALFSAICSALLFFLWIMQRSDMEILVLAFLSAAWSMLAVMWLGHVPLDASIFAPLFVLLAVGQVLFYWLYWHKSASIKLYALILLWSVPLLADATHAVFEWQYFGFSSAILSPIILLIAVWGVVARFIDQLHRSESEKRALDELVSKKTAELEAQFERNRELEKQGILDKERERIMRDIHDGVGGQLVSTLAMIEGGDVGQGQVSVALKDALTDMRLMIDSLDDVEDDLELVLARFRGRVEPQLRAAGLKLRWQIADLPQIGSLGPGRVLHILRILQEAVTNVLKHAQAREIGISANVEKKLVIIQVRDDGCGMDIEEKAPGHGLKNMQSRALAAGLSLSVSSGPAEGTCISLCLSEVQVAEQLPVGMGLTE